jgi:galactokinase
MMTRVFRAPGRVNLIGEHTDYNEGFVLPVALDLATTVTTEPEWSGPPGPLGGPEARPTLRIHSEERGETAEFEIASLASLQPARAWTDYPIGVAQELLKAGFPIAPANLTIRSTVPEGAGLSSSAALEVACALAFLLGRPIAPLDLARLCQRAERNFVGMPCGIMDQYISIFGRENSAVEIDCRTLGHRLVALPADISFMAVNTMVKHALAASAYKDRVAECAAAGRDLGVSSLRDAAASDNPRARHVISENARVHHFVDAAARGDVESMGRLMVASHRSLQHDYEVSCTELDFLVDTALAIDGVLGSRMTGGGFGGCTVTLLRAGAEEPFRRRISSAYQQKFGAAPAIYSCVPSAGATEVVGPAGSAA